MSVMLLRLLNMKVTLFLLFLQWSNSVIACSCLNRSFEQHVNAAKQIYVGKLISVNSDKERSQEEGQAEKLKENPLMHRLFLSGDIEVSHKLKGEIDDIEKIKTGLNSASCGIPLEEGEIYLIFSEDDLGNVNACSASQIISIEDLDSKLVDVRRLLDAAALSSDNCEFVSDS